MLKSHRGKDDLLLDVLKAGEQAGFPLTEDFNGKQQEGFSRYEHTMKDTSSAQEDGVRQGLTYILLLKEKNLSTETNVQVNKIIFEGKKAVGVQYLKSGQTITCRSNKEIILSAEQ